MISIEHYLVLSAVMFFAGVYGFLTRKNMLAVLISIELMLNAVELNFSVFNRFLYPEGTEGMFFSLFGIAIAAAETAVAIAIIMHLYRHRKDLNIRHITKLKH